jgi:hypothetical protein
MAEITSNTASTPDPHRNSNANQNSRRRGRGGSRGAEAGRGGIVRGVGRGGGWRGSGQAQLQGQVKSQNTALGSRGPNPRKSRTASVEGGGDDGGRPPGQVPLDGGTFGDRLTGDAIHTEGDGGVMLATNGVASERAEEDADDGEVCFICASRVEHTSVAPCNHRTCHICALRLRALYKTKACAHCRVW